MIDLTPLFIQYKIGWVNGNHYILLFPKDYNDELIHIQNNNSILLNESNKKNLKPI